MDTQKNKKRIMFVVSLPPPVHGSNIMNQYVVNNPELKDKFVVEIFSVRYASSIAEIGEIGFRKMIIFFGLIFRLFLLIIKFKPNYVYFVPAVTGLSFYRDCVLVLIFRILRIHIIFHLHGKGIKNRTNNAIRKKIYKWFFQKGHVIQLSPLLFDDIKNIVPSDQVLFLPNGINVDSNGIKRESDSRKKSFRILFLSNLVISKGPLVLLEACSILKKEGYDFETIYVGNPSRELSPEEFENQIKSYELQNYVHYLGPKYGEDKKIIFQSSDVLVFPTYYELECFPLNLLEAMAFALPVIATHEGAIPEIVDDGLTGFIVDSPDPAVFADKLKFLIRNPDKCMLMGRAAFLKFQQNYRLEIFRRDFVDLMQRITMVHSQDQKTKTIQHG